MKLVLCGLQSPINIGMILRTAELFGNRITFVDTYSVQCDDESMKVISDFACGALERTGFESLNGYDELGTGGSRLIATVASNKAKRHSDFVWRQSDIILIGNEYTGVPESLRASASEEVGIRMPNVYLPKPTSNSPIDPTRVQQIANPGEPALNVAVAASILIVTAFEKLREPQLKVV